MVKFFIGFISKSTKFILKNKLYKNIIKILYYNYNYN